VNAMDYEPTTEDVLVKDFLEKFDGSFSIEIPEGEVYYEDKDGEWYETPESKNKFFDMLLQSIKQNSNLFLANKYINEDKIIL